jgi:hypothetical protein
MGILAKRYYCYNNDNDDGYCSRWDSWGRWVVLGIIIVLIILAVASLTITARRRRRRGRMPMYGTGWMAPTEGKFGVPPPYPPPPGDVQLSGVTSGPPPPMYGSPPPNYPPNYPPAQYQQNQPTGQTFNSNDGYYGQPNSAGFVQQPTGTFQRDNVYEPPAGPPPRKN